MAISNECESCGARIWRKRDKPARWCRECAVPHQAAANIKLRRCLRCGDEFQRPRQNARQYRGYCELCEPLERDARAQSRKRQAERRRDAATRLSRAAVGTHGSTFTPLVAGSCPICGHPTVRRATGRALNTQPWTMCCTDVCAEEMTRRSAATRRSIRKHKQRAAHYGVSYEPVNSLRVFERDNWTCGICAGPVDPAAKYPDPMSASLDHVIPISRGGPHSYENTQCAHWICNTHKGDRLEDDAYSAQTYAPQGA